jgi:hypothetical protein
MTSQQVDSILVVQKLLGRGWVCDQQRHCWEPHCCCWLPSPDRPPLALDWQGRRCAGCRRMAGEARRHAPLRSHHPRQCLHPWQSWRARPAGPGRHQPPQQRPQRAVLGNLGPIAFFFPQVHVIAQQRGEHHRPKKERGAYHPCTRFEGRWARGHSGVRVRSIRGEFVLRTTAVMGTEGRGRGCVCVWCVSRETGNGPALTALRIQVGRVTRVKEVRVVMLGSASSWPPCRRWQHRRSPPTHHGPRRHPHRRPLPPRPLVVQHPRCHWWRRLVLPPWEQAWPAVRRANQQAQTSATTDNWHGWGTGCTYMPCSDTRQSGCA